jgi:L-aspartate oxidase
VLLATGGYAALWERTTNPLDAVGDGVAMAYRAGAAVADLEFVQFHPTVVAGRSLLLSEALRGAGALLLAVDGRRFTDELGPRDVGARAGDVRGGGRLDLRPIGRSRFSGLMRALVEIGFDPARRPIPVEPAAHYTVGGVVTDFDGRTAVLASTPPASAPARASTARIASRRTHSSSAWCSAVAPRWPPWTSLTPPGIAGAGPPPSPRQRSRQGCGARSGRTQVSCATGPGSSGLAAPSTSS